jgi:hypothetical protein
MNRFMQIEKEKEVGHQLQRNKCMKVKDKHSNLITVAKRFLIRVHFLLITIITISNNKKYNSSSRIKIKLQKRTRR